MWRGEPIFRYSSYPLGFSCSEVPVSGNDMGSGTGLGADGVPLGFGTLVSVMVGGVSHERTMLKIEALR